MKTKYGSMSLSLGLGLALVCGFLWIVGDGHVSAAVRSDTGASLAPIEIETRPAAVLHVCTTCTFTTIQAAVDAANPGDEIWIATGVYNAVNSYGGLSQVVYLTKTLTLRGGYNSDFSAWDPEAYPTTLNANGLGRVLYISGDISPTIEYLRLTGGDATDLGGAPYGGYDAGGGIYIYQSQARLQNNLIFDNVANTAFNGGMGGGVYLYESDALIISNTISGNDGTLDSWSDGSGGGLYAEGGALLVRGNLVIDNQAGVGGFFGFGDGGGLYFANAQPSVEANEIRGNRSVASGDWGIGGGVVLGACQGFTLTNNIIADNAATYSGSEIYLQHISGVPCRGQFIHNTIARHQSVTNIEGVRVTGSGTVVTFTNTILAGHDTGINVSQGTTATLTATLWNNTTDWGDVGDIFTGTINLWGEPDFLNPGGGDYHIAISSPARNQGMDAGVSTDIDGEPRDATPDLGADEVGAQSLRVIKNASTTLLYPGDDFTYTIAVHSAGTLSVTNVILTDTFPTLQRPIGVLCDWGSCAVLDAGYGGIVTCTLGNLQAGQSAHITLTAQVTTTLPPDPPHTMRNNVLATSNQAQTTAYADTFLNAPPNCLARINGALPNYTIVQAAVDAASTDDEVWIAGACRGASERAGLVQQVYLTKSLTLRGGYSMDFAAWDPAIYPTLLDAEGQGRLIYATGSITVAVEHLQLTGGDASGLGGDPDGFGDAGGGLYAISATVSLSHCQIENNAASAAMFGTGFGGGAAIYTGTLMATDSRWTGNTGASDSWGNGYGGALFAQGSIVRLENDVIQENAASGGLIGTGGGVYVYQTDLQAEASLWLSNTVSALGLGLGGGLYVGGESPFMLVNCAWLNNRAGDGSGDGGSALQIERASGVLLQPTIARNRDSVAIGAEYTATIAITNAVIVSHNVGIKADKASLVTVNGVLWHANVSDTVSISATIQISNALAGDPAFASDGYHLTRGSQALDHGIASGVVTDIDGQARPSGAGYDLGADEFTCATGVGVDGPLSGYAGRVYDFSAAVSPLAATVPITFTWQATDLSPSLQEGGITDTISYAWPGAGTKSITVTAQNCLIPVSATHTIEIVECVTLGGITLDGLPTTTLGLPATFTATVSPANVIQPITYTWQATGQPAQFHPGSGLGDTAVFTWTVTGSQLVTVTAINECGVMVTETHLLTITNVSPVAEGGPDQNVLVGEMVGLDGNSSYDPDGHYPLAYAWTQTAGPAVGGPWPVVNPTFTAPDTPAILTFTLSVTDAYGLPDPSPDQVTIAVNDIAITGLSVESSSPSVLGQPTVFTASITGGSNVVYAWAFGDGGSVQGGGPAISHTYAAASVYVAVVTATNGAGDVVVTTPITVTNAAPVADAGEDQAVTVGDAVTLDGSGSYDPDGHLPLAYAWTQTGGPAVGGPWTVATPTFSAPGTTGLLTFTLIVTDSYGLASTPDVIVVTVNNTPPVANAGADQTVLVGDAVTLDGSGSYDLDGHTLTYWWQQTGGMSITLSDNSVVSPAFTAPGSASVLTFTLAVTDSFGLADPTPDIVVITVQSTSKMVYLPLVMK